MDDVLKAEPESSGASGVIAEWLDSLRSGPGLGLAALFALIGVIVVISIAGASRDAGEGPPAVEPVPLTEEALGAWIDAAIELGYLKADGKLRVSVDTLAAFVEWGRHNLGAFEPALGAGDPVHFLGVTLSLHRARANQQALDNHRIRIEALDQNGDLVDEAFRDVPLPPAPTWSEVEETDRLLYEGYRVPVETAMKSFLPAVPSLSLLNPPAPAGEQPAPPERLRWRTVNKSRYGPRVVRGK
ncbi:MAG: hypothetical protein ACYS47_09160 [Planctomycetota bacterium]|jgi:hypothetical protein